MKDIKYVLAYLIPLSAWIGLEYRGFWVWATLIFTFGLVPLIDAIIPASTRNVPAEEEENRSKIFFFDLLLYACAPISFYLLFVYFQTLKNTGSYFVRNPGINRGFRYCSGFYGYQCGT